MKAFFLSLLLLTMLLTTAETPEASSLKLPAPRQLYVRGEVAPPSAPVPLRLVEVVESKPIKFPAEDEPIKVVAKAEPLGAAAEAEPIKPSSDAWPVKVAAEAELIKAAVKEEPIKVAAKEAPGKAESKVGPVKEAVQPPPHPFRNRNLRDRTTGSRAAQTKNVQKKAVTKRAAAASKRSTSSNIRRAKKGTAILNFSDAMIKNVIMTISEITGNNYILSPEVINRKISIRTTKPIKKGDISGIFDTILAVNGLASVKTGDYYTIVPAKSAIQSNIRLYTGSDPRNIPGGDAMINLLVPIEFISALDVLEIIKPSLSAGGNIAHYPLANTLIITDTASKVKKFLALIDEIDIDLFEKLNVSLVHINNVDVKTLSQELIDIFDVLGYEKKSHQFSAVPLERFNSIILFSSNKKLMASARKWIEELDKNSSSDEITTHIYYVQNDKASNIRGVLTEIYGGQTKEDTNRDTVQGPAAADAAPPPHKK
ncbi:MAG: secretin N-terminal domain-containing protein [Thermodesulfobacteriota bacterium]